MPDEEQNNLETPSVDETIDTFLEEKNQPPQETEKSDGSPKKVETVEDVGSETDSPKTEEPTDPADFEGTPKGFANHPAWLKREQKLKDAQAELETLKSSSSQTDALLGDSAIYKRSLELQGYSENKINEMMREKGFEVEEPKTTKVELAEKVCGKLGWNLKDLSQQQKAVVKDVVSVSEAVTRELLEDAFKKKLGPVENFVENNNRREQLVREERDVKTQANEEFPELNWEKDIEPAMHKYLDELQKNGTKQRIDFSTLYERATRQILKEQQVRQNRQEDRNSLKKNARPLQPGAIVTPEGGLRKGKTVDETVENFYSDHGL